MNGHTGCAELEVRPLRAGDDERLNRLFERLSPDTVYRRFFTRFPGLPPAILRYFAAADHEDHERLAVLCGDEIVAVASWDRDAPGAAAEVGILVEDAWQHRGLGSDLIRTLVSDAAGHGVTTVT